MSKLYNDYATTLKEAATAVLKKVKKGDSRNLYALVEIHFQCGHLTARTIANDLINLGIGIKRDNLCEIAVSEDDLETIWNSYLFKRLVAIREEDFAEEQSDNSATKSEPNNNFNNAFDPNDPVVREAVDILLKHGKFSTAMLQTYLGKGYGFISRLALWLENIGVIGPVVENGPRDVLISSMKEFEELSKD